MSAMQPVAELAQLRWPEVENGPRRLLVVPVGSLEQHGPHLPLDTDTRIAVAVARRACAGRPGVALAPAFAIGASGEHAAFPGTLSIGSEALTACLIELGRHASLHWPATLLVNGHGGNVTAVQAAVDQLRYEGRRCESWHAGLPGGDAHAGRSETSLMLALDPDVVRLDAAGPGEIRPVSEIMPILRERGVRAVSPNGVLGDPAGASAAEGERLLARLAGGLNEALDLVLQTLEARLLQARGGAERIPGVLVQRVEVVVRGVGRRGRAVGERPQHVRGHLYDEGRRGRGNAVRAVTEDRLHPAHGAGVEDAGPARVRVVGRITEAADALADQR
jgi:creatinine amidohydrolase